MSLWNHNIIIELNIFICRTLEFSHKTYFWIKLDFDGLLKDKIKLVGVPGRGELVSEGGACVPGEWAYHGLWACPQVGLTCMARRFRLAGARFSKLCSSSWHQLQPFVQIPSSFPKSFPFSPSHALPNSLSPQQLRQSYSWLVFFLLTLESRIIQVSPALRNQGGNQQMTSEVPFHIWEPHVLKISISIGWGRARRVGGGYEGYEQGG